MGKTSDVHRSPRLTADTGLLVLLVEDEPNCASLLARLVDKFGHQIRVAPDGPSALERAEREPPDVVLLDISLPGMDGYEVARRLRGNSGRKPPLIVALSGYADDEERREAAGIDLHVLKPVDPDALGSLLQRFGRVVGEDGTADGQSPQP
jgi:CheY-like chemotaxis protein